MASQNDSDDLPSFERKASGMLSRDEHSLVERAKTEADNQPGFDSPGDGVLPAQHCSHGSHGSHGSW